MTKHIDPADVVGIGSGGDAAGAGTYTVDLFDIDGGIIATLATFERASEATMFTVDVHRKLGDWFNAAEECGRDNFVAYLSERKS